METESKTEVNQRAAWGVPLVLVSGVLFIAGLVELLTDKLDGADPAFFSTAAQVAPVFGLAVFVEVAVVMAPAVRHEPTAAAQTTVMMLIRANTALLLLSEGTALFATATRSHSGLAVLFIVLPWLGQLLLLVDAAYYRVGVSRLKRRR